MVVTKPDEKDVGAFDENEDAQRMYCRHLNIQNFKSVSAVYIGNKLYNSVPLA